MEISNTNWHSTPFLFFFFLLIHLEITVLLAKFHTGAAVCMNIDNY